MGRDRVALFAAVREDHRRGTGIRAIARKYGVHRRTVREALASPVPAPRKVPERASPTRDAVAPLIDAMLREDLDAPRKQRHTARRIWCRLADEHGVHVSYSYVAKYVARRRAEAAAVTAAARQAEAEAEAQALAEALQAARDDQTAAGENTRQAAETAAGLAAELDQLRRDAAARIAAAEDKAAQQAAAARDDAARFQRERDNAIADARDARTGAGTETARARQAEADARDEARRVRDDAARERDALRESHAAQLEAQRVLTDAERARAERAEAQLETERADRRQLTTRIAGNTSQDSPPTQRSGARSK